MALLKSNTIIYGTANIQSVLTVGAVTPNNSISSTTGSLIVYGGAGITGNVYANSVYANGLDLYSYSTSAYSQANVTAGGLVTANANIAAAFAQANSANILAQAAFNKANTGFNGGTITNTLTIANTTTSNSNTTGALVVNGSIGVASNVYVGFGGVMGFANTTTGVSAAYTFYNPTYGSLDTVFG